ncbi:MAG TPA: hypothetical protein VLC12_13730 [Terriglobales bacterium]|nr:hypothetical protein [Terriglobales bacterium]
MRRILLLSTILLALSAWMAAQQAPNTQNPPSSGQGAQSSAGQNSVQGCLGGSGSNFTVTDKSGTSYQLQLPQGANPAALKPHVGEEVRVEGNMSNGSSSGQAAGGSSAGGPSINVKNIYRVSPTCSAKGSGAAPKSQ